MPAFTITQYSRTQTVDLETAIAQAVLAVINRPFPGPGGEGQIQLAQVFEDWADFEDNFVDPSAAILPDDEVIYGPSHATPTLLEDTWEPVGQAGFGLFELSEASREFELSVRTSSSADRAALKAGIETVFQNDSVLIAPPNGVRYGLVVLMPGYWNLPCRLTLLRSRKLDDTESASKKIAEVRFRIAAQAPHVKIAPVQPFRLKLTVTESDGSPM